jgi:hypothetical protein
MVVEKSISYQIESQFPAIYRENGRELIELVKEYYVFLETTSNQSSYNSRRMFEYRDIDTTLESMIVFFKNKYLSGLPYSQENIRFIVKNILDLYRRKGSEDGLKLFFEIFYDQTIKVYYPGEDIFKPSSSEWVVGRYLQLFPDKDIFKLRALIGKKITGSITKSEAIVEKINFFLLNETLTPVLYISNIVGQFTAFDNILSLVDGVSQIFGRVNGSLDAIAIDTNDPDARSGYRIGAILDCACSIGSGAKVVVTSVTENFTGEIIYTVIDGGFGYTEDSTRLLVSNQSLFIQNTNRILNVLETLEDQFGNRGVVIGQDNVTAGVKMEEGLAFTIDSIISTVDRANNIIVPVTEVTAKNESSPGLLYPDALSSNTASESDIEFSVRASLDNIETVSLIRDVIANFLDVPLNAADYSDSPALIPMSGTADPITIDTPLNEAFNLDPFEIGRLIGFANINPGAEYRNKVFALAQDVVIQSFIRNNQVITLNEITPSFAVGDIVSQGSTNGIIRSIIDNTMIITPYSYYGFSASLPLTFRNVNYDILVVSTDYSSLPFGFNSNIDAVTDFAIGKVKTVDVINSGLGYIDKSKIRLRDSNGDVAAIGVVSVQGQGVSEGYWKSFDSHMNIYDNKKIQDSFFYQDYSYEVTSEIDINTYESTLKDVAHLAGTKVFGKFAINRDVDISSNIQIRLDF